MRIAVFSDIHASPYALRAVEYDFNQKVRAILRSGMPGKASAAALYRG